MIFFIIEINLEQFNFYFYWFCFTDKSPLLIFRKQKQHFQNLNLADKKLL